MRFEKLIHEQKSDFQSVDCVGIESGKETKKTPKVNDITVITVSHSSSSRSHLAMKRGNVFD